MKHSIKHFSIIILISFFLPTVSNSQEIKSTDSLGIEMIKIAEKIIDSSRYCGLITIDKDGLPRVRPMDPFKPECGLVIWFGTKSQSRKAEQIKNDPRVSLYYLSNDASAYLIINGKAELIDDKEAKEKRWKDAWKDFYPDKNKDYLLIKVIPTSIELISEKDGIFGDPKTWKPPVIIFE